MRILFCLIGLIISGSMQTALAAESNPGGSIPDKLECGDSFFLPDGTEVHVICGSVSCEQTEVSINGECIDRGYLDFLCSVSLLPCGGSGNPLPEDPIVGDGDGDSNPAPTRPTLAKCSEELDGCADRVVAGVKACRGSHARGFGILTSRGETCFGNIGDILEQINSNVTVFNFSELCLENMLDTRVIQPFELRAQAKECQDSFQIKAMGQCIRGLKTTVDTSTLEAGISLDVGFEGYIGVGADVSGSQSVSVTTPAAVGSDQACSTLGRKMTTKCSEAKSVCDAAATESAMLVGVLELGDAEVLRRAIDAQRLGFGSSLQPTEISSRPFRALSQAEGELNERYLDRMTLLKNWSDTLTKHGVTEVTQQQVQAAMITAQSQLTKLNDSFVSLLIMLWKVDQETGKAGSPEATELFKQFEARGGYDGGLAMSEAAFLKQIEQIWTPQQHAAFLHEVWPGIRTFAYVAPMNVPAGALDQ